MEATPQAWPLPHLSQSWLSRDGLMPRGKRVRVATAVTGILAHDGMHAYDESRPHRMVAFAMHRSHPFKT